MVTGVQTCALPICEYALANLPFITLYCAFSVFMCTYVIPRGEHVPEEDHLEEVVRQRLQEMGPMTVQEWKLFILMVVAITGLLTQKWHGMPGTYVYAFMGMLCYLPWMGLARAENAKHLNVGFIVFVSKGLAIGFAALTALALFVAFPLQVFCARAIHR